MRRWLGRLGVRKEAEHAPHPLDLARERRLGGDPLLEGSGLVVAEVPEHVVDDQSV